MSNPKTVIIASNNAHKAEEIAHALDFPGWEFRTLKEAHIDSDPAEDADSFLGNARIKAKAAWEAAKEALGIPSPCLRTTRGSRSMRSTARRACSPHATPASMATTPRTTRSCCASWAKPPMKSERRASCARLSFWTRTATRRMRTARWKAASGTRSAGEHRFGYDPLFLAEVFDFKRTLAEAPARGEERHLASRECPC